MIPPPDAPLVDAGRFHAPRVLRDGTTPPFDEILQWTQSPGGQALDKVFNVVLEDVDNQILYARVFIQRPTAVPSYSTKVEISNDRVLITRGQNSLFFKITGLCDEWVNKVAGPYRLELYVSDSEFLEGVFDLRDNKAGGYRVNEEWLLQCSPFQGTPDAGVRP